MFELFFDRQPSRFLKKLDDSLAKRIIDKLQMLTFNPIPQNAVRIAGTQGVFRVRIGDYRALYRIDYTGKVIVIVALDKRARVYD